MNLPVTGGTGYLGSAVTDGLLADGHTVRAHVRSIASADRLPAGAGPVAVDLDDAAGLRARADESGGVVHAATPNDATSGFFDAAFLHARLGLFLATFMLLPDTAVVNTALPSIQGEES